MYINDIEQAIKCDIFYQKKDYYEFVNILKKDIHVKVTEILKDVIVAQVEVYDCNSRSKMKVTYDIEKVKTLIRLYKIRNFV